MGGITGSITNWNEKVLGEDVGGFFNMLGDPLDLRGDRSRKTISDAKEAQEDVDKEGIQSLVNERVKERNTPTKVKSFGGVQI